MILKKLNCYLLVMLLAVPMIWSQERAIRPVTSEAISENRQALVIGNSEYQYAGRLRNPVNDARAIGSILKQLGFKVTTITNADQRKIERSIRNFGKQLKQNKGVGLFYFAGHGMQFDGENYLLPTDIDPSTEEDVRYDAVPLGKLLAQMRAADNKMNIVVLDACRNNPFARSFRTLNPGLAQVNAAAGTFISFATAPGQIAADGEGSNGLFTSKLLQHLATPGLKIEEVFKRTTADVYQASGRRQAPWVQYSVIGDFFFVPKSLPPEMPNQTTLSDLQKRANAEQAARLEQQRLEAQWKEWQQKMQEDYEGVSTFEKRAVESALKVESWQRFLSNWADDNPYSTQDAELRSGAQAKVSYWQKDQKVEREQNIIVVSGEAAKKKLLETKHCVGCDLRKANLRPSLFSRVDLTKADLRSANLQGADLWRARLESANLSGANLREANLSEARLSRANLRGANLQGADLRASLRYADLQGANLQGANLRASLWKANLRGANLQGADLRWAELWGADLREANLFKADIDINTSFKRAKYCNTTMPDGTIRNDDC